MNVQNNKIQMLSNFKSSEINNAPKYIQDIVKDLENASTRDEMFEILDNATQQTSDFICLDDTEFVGNGYKFQCTLKNYTKNINSSNIKLPSGWELIKVIPIGESSSSVILTKVKPNA